MARRTDRLGNSQSKPKVERVVRQASLDYHEGLSANQVKIILHELGLDYGKFCKWINGQTCPVVSKTDHNGQLQDIFGFYEYDVFRWIANQKKGTPLIWD